MAVLARKDWEEASACVRHAPEEPTALATADDFEGAIELFFADYKELRFDHSARLAEHTQITDVGDYRWQVIQILLDPEDDNLWCIEGRVDLSDDATIDGPLVAVTRIGT